MATAPSTSYAPAQLSSAAKWAWGQCTYYVGLFFNIPWQGDAWQWATESQWPKSGYDSSSPAIAAAGDIVVFQPGVAGADTGTGHVAIVTGIDPGGKTFDVAEMNWGGVLDKVHTRTGVPLEGGETFIVPPQSADVAAPPTTGTATSANSAQLTGLDLNPADWVGAIVGGAANIPGAIGSGIAGAFADVLGAIAKPLENVVIRLMLAAFGAVLVIVALHILAGSAERDVVTAGAPQGGAGTARRASVAEEAPEAAAAA